MIDASYIKAHPHMPALGAEIRHCPHQRGLNSKLHLAVDSHGMPVRLAVTGGTVADCSLALPLIEGIEAECLWRTKPRVRDYDQALYKLRHLVENGFSSRIGPPRHTWP